MISENSFHKTVLKDWNNTSQIYSENKLIDTLFSESVEKYPNKRAIITSTKSITYSQLNAEVDLLVNNLKKQGYHGRRFIGVYLDRSIDTIVALLAILKLGCAYVPFNTNDPKERIRTITKQADLSAIITKAKYREIIPNGIPLILLDVKELSGNKNINSNPNKTTSFDSHAYIIFTSGTTGVPKGVLVNHKSVVNLIEWVNGSFNVNEQDILLWTTNLCFDLSVYDIFGILAAGGAIRVLTEEEQSDPQKQVNIILEEGITFWDSAPQVLQRLLPHLSNVSGKKISMQMRLIFASGDWIPLKLPGFLLKFFPNAKFVALGGATEASIWSNYYIVKNNNPNWKSIPYGKPIQNSRYYILDKKFGHCLPGVEGDLYIGGDCLAVGYYGDSELTTKKFPPDPFYPGERMYATGDRARWMDDGNIEFLGRVDDQVKIRGYRIELEEIRFQAKKIEGIGDIFLYADKTDMHNPILVMAYTCIGNNVETNELRTILSERLPDYMVPSKLLKVNEFPLTPNGKIDKNKLITKNNQLLKLQPKLTIKNPIEKKLLVVWGKLLKAPVTRIDESFFEMGGDSLLALRLINQVDKKFGINITYRDFSAENFTIESLASFIKNKGAYRKKVNSVKKGNFLFDHLYCIQPKGTGIPLFMVYGERALLFEDSDFGKFNPVYAFVWPGSDGEKFSVNSVEQLASDYLQQIKSIHPSGPYFISGFSFGALVAMEMAIQLQKEGESVPILALMDAPHPETQYNKIEKWKYLIRKYGLFDSIFYKKIGLTISWALRKFYYKIVSQLTKRLFFKLPLGMRKRIIFIQSLRLYFKYRPEKFKGDILLFKVPNDTIEDANLGWSAYANNITKIKLVGAHLDILDLRQNREIVSRELRKSINIFMRHRTAQQENGQMKPDSQKLIDLMTLS